jgi:hypothetical protein
VGDYLISKQGLKEKIEKSPFRYDAKTEVFIAVSKKSRLAAHLPLLNTKMAEMVSEGKPEAVKDDYLRRLNAK